MSSFKIKHVNPSAPLRAAVVHGDVEYAEYTVKFYRDNGKYMGTAADYFTCDLSDAMDTGHAYIDHGVSA